MVGRLVEQQHIGVRHQHAGQHRQPLPAAAQLLQRHLVQRLGHVERFQGHIDPPAFAEPLLDGQRLQHGRMERRVQQRCRDVLLDIAHVKPARSDDLAFAGLMAAAMQRSSVVFPRPLAATSPIRSPGLTTRFSRENSGVPSVTPRLRIVISVMIVLWSCRPPRFRWHAAIIGRRCQSAAIDKMRSRTQKRANSRPRRADQKDFSRRMSGQPCKRICRAWTGPHWR